jgi:hypothetical protein
LSNMLFFFSPLRSPLELIFAPKEVPPLYLTVSTTTPAFSRLPI